MWERLGSGSAVPHGQKLSTANAVSTRLRIKLQLVHEELFRGGHFSGTPPEIRERYKEYLFVLHSVVRSSVPVMRAAEERCLLLEKSPLSAALSGYYRVHAAEEINHDNWLLEDLELIGVGRRTVLSRKPFQSVAELVGSQYYWIHHFHPVCLLGYIAVLEGYPPEYSDLLKLRARTGYPRAAFRTLAEHSSLDRHHIEEFWKMLDSLPLGKSHEEWITLNGIYTLDKWKEIIGILDGTLTKRRQAPSSTMGPLTRAP